MTKAASAGILPTKSMLIIVSSSFSRQQNYKEKLREQSEFWKFNAVKPINGITALGDKDGGRKM